MTVSGTTETWHLFNGASEVAGVAHVTASDVTPVTATREDKRFGGHEVDLKQEAHGWSGNLTLLVENYAIDAVLDVIDASIRGDLPSPFTIQQITNYPRTGEQGGWAYPRVVFTSTPRPTAREQSTTITMSWRIGTARVPV